MAGLGTRLINDQEGHVSKQLKARDVMTPNPVTVRPDSPLTEAVRLLMDYQISGLPVVDGEKRLVGMITEKDMLRILYEQPGSLRSVADLMSTRVRCFESDDPLENVVDCLMANHFRRVPVLEHGILVGLISRADLMGTILDVAEERLRQL
jgi:CBS domain-containing protein